MRDHDLTREEFIERAKGLFGEAYVERQQHTIERCHCTSPNCLGWRIDASAEDDPLFVFNPPVMEV